ncbi:MAG TPA: tetratricopeptide repeat protein [Rhodanobacteraceae bacterium]|nr:tetratricopeptide repeat protein [Rhodanobacteraceae bacterium]
MADGRNLLEELKRRHVWRVAIAYAVAGWLVVQIATQVFPFFNIPNWAVRLVVVLIVIGFPVAVAFAWIYELTPTGLRRTAPADSPDARPEQEHRQIGRKLNAIIVAALVLAVALLGWRVLALRHAPASAETEAAAAASPDEAHPGKAIPAKSIAVLPFENLSNDKSNAYFADGMQDMILTKLADVGDLKVISRTSTMQYGSHPENLKQIGQQLGVATILEGSVQKAANEVLINVQLIDARTDGHIWAQSYTRTLDNIFGVEGDVAGQIAGTLSAKLSPAQSAQLTAVPTRNPAAYDAFFRAEYQANRGLINYDTASWKAAIPLYRQAVQADPDFALAWARLSYNESQLAWFGGGGQDVKQLNQQARADAEQALKLAPNLAASQLALGFTEYWGREDYDAALKAFAEALKLKPNDTDALAAQGFVQRRMGHFDAAIASLQQASTLDPRDSALAFELGLTYSQTSRYAEAEQAYQRALALDPHNLNAKSNYAFAILFSTGDVPRALAAAQGDDPFLRILRVSFLTDQRNYRDALALLDGIPDTADDFSIGNGGFKSQQQANLYWLMGDVARARPLYAQALARMRPLVEVAQGSNLAFVLMQIANAEIGLGQNAEGLDTIAKSLKTVADSRDQVYGPAVMLTDAQTYAQARRPDLAVPLLAKALAEPGIGQNYSPVMLWLDPDWDPIGRDPRFQALQAQYAKYKPAVVYPIPPAGVAAAASAPAQSAAK